MARVSAVQRRQDFIEAAVRIIAQHGVRGATTRRIADEAGAPLATLHYCFHTKEALFLAVFQHLSETIAGDVDDDAPVGLAAASRRWIDAVAAWLVANDDAARAQWELYFWALRQEESDPGLGRGVYDIFLGRLRSTLRASLLPTEDASLVDPLSEVLVAIIDGLSLQWHGHHETGRLDRGLAFACSMVTAIVEEQMSLEAGCQLPTSGIPRRESRRA